MRGNYEELSCPFCDTGRIRCWHIPSSWSEKRQTSETFGRKRLLRKNPDIWLIQSGCNICGKSQEEVKEELKKKNVI
jgi:hypothetical protein